MALAYMTNFSGLTTFPTNSYYNMRLDGADWHDESHHVNIWDSLLGSIFYSKFLPYVNISSRWNWLSTPRQDYDMSENGSFLRIIRQNGANVAAEWWIPKDNIRVCVPSIKKMCVGVLAHFVFPGNVVSDSMSDRRGCSLRFDFQAAQNLHSFTSGPKTNFGVEFNWSTPLDRFVYGQSVSISFSTGGSGKPHIPGATVYYDFNQPLWFWVECDMLSHSPGSDAPVGNCRVWLNNDLVCSRLGILTADTSTWSANPWHAWHNICDVRSENTAYYRDRERRFFGLAVTDDKLSYMDSSLGDIGIVSLPIVGAAQAQFAPHHGGVDLDIENAEVLNDRMAHINSTDLYGQSHLRATEHLARDMFIHQHPFPPEAHILCVQQGITHRKHLLSGDTSKYRIEPTTKYSGRPTTMHRNFGHISIPASLSTSKSLTVSSAQHTIPYPGAFWTEEILRHAHFGYTCYDSANPALVNTNLDLLGEYDVENVDDGVGFEEEVIDGDEE